jgi:SpoVK/Ycf46/Vps4 family AAA+-type ATPase
MVSSILSIGSVRQNGCMFTPSIEETWVPPVTVPQRGKEVWRTASQKAAYDRLVAIAKIHPEAHHANFCPRTRAILMTGPAGSGKTAVVRAYSRLAGLPILSLLSSAWVPIGALQPPTILAIRDFVRLHKTGVIYLDEADKVCPAGAEVRSSSWAQGILGEVISWIDADMRLVSMGWSAGDVSRFRHGYRIIASGAWQHVDARVRAASTRGALGFGGNDHGLTYGDAFAQDDAVPEEIRFRFFGERLHIDLPNREDFRDGICRIHEDLEYVAPITEKIISEAVQSRLGVRWLEGYVARILLQHPELNQDAEDARDEQDKEQNVRRISKAEYAVLHGKLSEWAISLRQALFRYEAALILALDRPSCSSAVACLVEEGWYEHPALLGTVQELQEALAPLEANTMDSNRTYELLQGLTCATKYAIQKQAAGLQRAGLLPQTVATRELADRIETVMKSLIGVEVPCAG